MPLALASTTPCLRVWTTLEVERDVADGDAELFRLLDLGPDVGVLEERFGGDAAAVQARAAEERIFLDDGHLHAELPGADAGDIAARTAADDDDVVLLFCHAGRHYTYVWGHICSLQFLGLKKLQTADVTPALLRRHVGWILCLLVDYGTVCRHASAAAAAAHRDRDAAVVHRSCPEAGQRDLPELVAASGMSVLMANFESGRTNETCAVTGLPEVSASPMFVRKRSDDSSCRSCSVPPEPMAWLGVTPGMNWPYVPALLAVYVRAVATSDDADDVDTMSDPPVCWSEEPKSV